MIRTLDILLCSIASFFFFPLIILLYLLIYLENRSPFFIQKRIGKNLKEFNLIKFRTMKKGTKSCATHLVDNNNQKLGNY